MQPLVHHTLNSRPKLRQTPHILNILQRPPHPHNTIPNHPRIQPQRPFHRMLRLGRAVEPHNEVMPRMVQGAVFPQRLGQQEGAPVCDAADNAGAVDNDVAGGLGNSGNISGE